MRKILFDPSTLTGSQKSWWDAWSKKAEEATEKVIDAWEQGKEIPFNSDLWGELKQWLLENIFHGKCAYCETLITRASPDAEHYRPKAAVTIKDKTTGKAISAATQDTGGSQMKHPGYFWLAHNWKNLFPSCEFCNSGRGKQNQFPLSPGSCHVLLRKLSKSELGALKRLPRESAKWTGHYYLDPGDLDWLESPLLLHPYVEQDPRKHLRFGERGIIAAAEGSLLGDSSIKVFRLNEENLRQARQEEQERAYNSYLSAKMIIAGLPRSISQRRSAAEEFLERYQRGEEKYSAAVLDYIELMEKGP